MLYYLCKTHCVKLLHNHLAPGFTMKDCLFKTYLEVFCGKAMFTKVLKFTEIILRHPEDDVITCILLG